MFCTRLASRQLLFVSTLLITAAGIAPPADAQGLFQRLRERIRSGPPAPFPPPSPSPIYPPATAAPSDRYGVDGRSATLDPPGRLVQPLGSDYQSYRAPVPNPIPPATLGQPIPRDESPSLGIRVVPAQRGRYRGLLVQEVLPGSRAGEVGLRPGDLIVEARGQPTLSIADVASTLRDRRVGETLETRIVRDSTLYRAAVPLIGTREAEASLDAPLPNLSGADLSTADRTPTGPLDPPPAVELLPPAADANPPASLGVIVQEIPGQRGIQAMEVPAGSAGNAMGLRPGDRIVSIDGSLVRDPSDFARQIRGRVPGTTVKISVVRGESLRTLSGPLAGEDGRLDIESVATADPPIPPKPAEGLLGGVGSMLGGLFSRPGGPTSVPAPDGQPQPDPSSLPSPQPSNPNVPATDQLALPEDPAGALEP